ncbi:MAG: gliding motility-associated C-terminal domain-containing protein [Bacteroidales bacterium]|nr:gliding motility-associated C-terminal domain-containing protein [Bacteroidales bacterium]
MKHIQHIKYYFFLLIIFVFPSLKQIYCQQYFQKVIESNTSIVGYTINLTEDGGIIIAGQSDNSILGGKDIVIIKFDSQGSEQWSKVYGGNSDELPRAIIQTEDMGYAIIGNTNSFGFGNKDIYFLRIDSNGEMIWSKTFGGNNEDRGFSVKQTNDNGYILGGSTQSFGAGLRDAYIIKTNNDGEILWTRVLGGLNLDNCFNINQTQDNGFILTGTEESYGPGQHSLLLTKLSFDGEIEWSKAIGGNIEEHSRIVLETLDYGFIILGHTKTWGAGYWDPILVKTDEQGNIQWAKTYGGYGEEFIGNVISTNDGGYAICGSTTTYGNGPRDLFIIRIDGVGNLIWASTYGGDGSEEIPFGGDNAIQQMNDGGFLLTGQSNSFTDDNAIYLIRTDSFGISGCNETSFTPSIQTVNPQANNTPTNYITGNNSQNVLTQVMDFLVVDSSLCTSFTLIAQFEASDSIICRGNCINFFDSSFYNPTSWNWFFEGGTPSYSNIQNPSNICYYTPGQFDVQLIVSNDFGSDSIIFFDYITVHPSPEIHLGNDTLICGGDSLILNAGSGFESYLWNTGSLDSIIVIDTSGLFWVEVTNEFGYSTTDSIHIEFYPYAFEELELGNDTSICFGNYIIINAGSGYTYYEWHDGSHDSIFIADTAGVYYVYVENPCGSGSDTIILDIFPVTDINLGNDTTVCFGEFIFLDAGDGFNSYLWQDGSSNQFYYAGQTGLYWVEATDTNLCYASDTIFLEFILPDPGLGNDTSICYGNSVTFYALDGFVSYLWQNGTDNIWFTADTTGVCWCEVIDTMGCVGSDSVFLETVLLPNISLGNDTGICLGDSISLNILPPDNGFDFIWQDGSNDSVFHVTEQGEYWVQASNECGTDTDSVFVSDILLPFVFLGNDTILALNDEIILDAGNGFESFLWNDSTTAQTLLVSDTGSYWVMVSDGTCFNSDTINIEKIKCDLFVPIIFTPNRDGFNDYFFAVASNDITDFELVVFNRWGEKIWETNNLNDKWDGKRNGMLGAEGTYFWITKYKCFGSPQEFIKKGSVTLLR